MSAPNPLVIVIGAGASAEVGFPVGSEIKESIAYCLNFEEDRHGGRASAPRGDQRIENCFHTLVRDRSKSHGTLGDYNRAAKKIREGMPLATSIDNFVDSHRTDAHIAQVAKLSIAARILEAEKGSALHVDKSNSYNRLDFNRLENTWFRRIFSLLSENCTHEEFADRLSHLTIVSFNYDRCFDQFLYHALLTYYSLDSQKAAEIASAVTVLHPYGSVGKMPFRAGAPTVDFGAELDSDSLLRSAKSIKTFTESTEDAEQEIAEIRECVAKAQALVYLGFAFHPQNMGLLYGTTRPPERSRTCNVFATAYGISDSNASQIANNLTGMGGYKAKQVNLRQDLQASALLSEYSLRLAAIVRNAGGP